MGTATATFTGLGNYAGATTVKFKIKDTVARASNINTANVTPSQVKHASEVGARSVTLGPGVKKISKGAFAKTKIKTVTITSTKLTKKSVKNALVNSNVKTVKVQVKQLKSTKGLKGKALRNAQNYNKKAQATNAKYAKKYAKFFTKANCGKKVIVK